MPPRSKRADAVRIRGNGRRLRGSRAFAQTPKNEPKTSDSVKELMAMVTATASDQTPPNPVARIVRRHYQISFNPN